MKTDNLHTEQLLWLAVDHLEQGIALFDHGLQCLLRNQPMLRILAQFNLISRDDLTPDPTIIEIPTVILNELKNYRVLLREQGNAARHLKQLTSPAGQPFFLSIHSIVHQGELFYLVQLTAHRARKVQLQEILRKEKGLTDQEARVVQEIWNGLSIQEIADLLHLSPATIKTHLQAVFNKFGVHRQVELLALLQKLIH